MDTSTVSDAPGPASPPADGGRIYYIQHNAGVGVWTADDGGGGPAGPKYRTSGIHLINGKKTMEVDAGASAFTDTVGDVNGQQPWSFSALLRLVTPVSGRATLFKNGDTPSVELFMDNSGNVGFSNNGSDTNVAAAVNGVQVLIWTFEPGVGVNVYRDTGSGLAQIGVTSANVDATGYELFNNCSFLGSAGGASDLPLGSDVAEFWAHPFVFDAGELAQQAAYLASQGGL